MTTRGCGGSRTPGWRRGATWRRCPHCAPLCPPLSRLGRLARIESWRRCVASMTEAEREEYGWVPAHYLALLLEGPPVGATPSAART
ncbi:hypothetical protein G5V59_27215 [Nocardioides sp. W3-2-3]|uniref:hypothetical protein n=1 Tax=Nocardioides convexus TaxID=2712224 RepID=UPI00241897F3|nr:hypothetical protein [Nocardioides convexus]NHA02080.1 hypothetical protein [Nocardioides convexus]